VGVTRETHAQVYAIGGVDSSVSTPLLRQLTEETGGYQFSVTDVAKAPSVAAKIGIEVRNAHVLEYSSKNSARDGSFRSVKVKLAPPRGLPPLTATSRAGYYAPGR